MNLRKTMKKFLSVLFLCLPLGALADQTDFGSGTTAAPWLKLPVSARSAAMGEIQAGMPSDVNALTGNPAWLSTLEGQQFSFMHNSWIQETSIEHAVYGSKVLEQGGLALGLDYVNMGNIEKFDVSSGVPVSSGSFTPSAFNGGFGWGQGFSNGLSAGLGFKYLHQSFDTTTGDSFGFDLGFGWKQAGADGFSLGLVGQNIGGQLDGSSLPLAERGGLGYRFEKGDNDLSAGVDVAYFNADSQAMAVSVGGEYWYHGAVAGRVGYKSVNRGSLPGLSGLNGGLGLKVSGVEVDYAVATLGELGNANLVSLVASF
jgi:hypothetical protein